MKFRNGLLLFMALSITVASEFSVSPFSENAPTLCAPSASMYVDDVEIGPLRSMKDPTSLELVILGAVWSLGEDAYGVTIKKRVAELSGRDLMYGTLYNALGQLVRKELLERSPGEPTPERGGRRKIYYRLSELGLRAFREAYEIQAFFWDRLAELGRTP